MSDIQVVTKPSPFSSAKMFCAVPEGATVADMVAKSMREGNVPKPYHDNVIVEINGQVVPKSMWHHVKPKKYTDITINVPLHGGGGGGGGKNPARIILQVVILIASIYTGGAVGAVYGAAWGAVASAAVNIAGNLLLNAVFPISAPKLPDLNGGGNSLNDSPTYSIAGARNELRPFKPVPVILGTHDFIPPLGARPYTEIVGDDEYLRQLFVVGYGPLKIEDIRIGSTPIDDFDDVEYEVREGRDTDDPITLIPSQVGQLNVGVTLNQSSGWIQRTTSSNTDEISVDLQFPRGLAQYTNTGSRTSFNVVCELQYRATGATTWISRPDFNVTEASGGAIRKNQTWDVTRGQYEVRMRRITADTESTQIIDDTQWYVLRSIRNDPPTNFPYPLAMIAVRIRASEQLSGVIDQLKCKVSSYVEDWNGSAWVEAVSNNPASLMRHVLKGNANARARTDAQVSDADMQEFHDWCSTNGYQFNMVRDFQSSVYEVCADICSSARAAPNINDGKWSVIIDQPNKPIVQHFTPRNSWGFNSSKQFPINPHALRVRFVDEDNSYEQDERIVYFDGYDEENATIFEGVEFAGVTDSDLIWKHARYHLAQLRLRPENFSFSASFENLICNRGDRIKFSHDVPLWGTGYPRVKSLVTSGSNTTGIIFDDAVTMETGKSYVVRVRYEDGSSNVFNLNTIAGVWYEVELTTPVLTVDGPQVGDLCMFGELNLESVDLLVESIRMKDDMTATISCRDYAASIHDADTGPIPTYTPNVTVAPDITEIPSPVPTILNIESGTSALKIDASGNFSSRILVSLASGGGSPRTDYMIVRYRESGGAWVLVEGATEQTQFFLSDVVDGVEYEIQAKSVSIYGRDSAWSTSEFETVVGQSEPPSDVTGLSVNVIGANAYLSWDAVTDIDFKHYRVRWSELKIGATWVNSVDVVSKITTNSATVPAQVGTYLVKAVDHAGNESAIAAAAITNISKIQNLNFVSALEEEDPNFNGTFTDTRYDGSLGGVTLNWLGQQLETESGDTLITEAGDQLFGDVPDGGYIETGIYELDGYLDLGGIFTVRANAVVDSSGNDIFSAIDLQTETGDFITTEAGDLIQAEDPANVPEGSYDVTVQYSLTDDDPAGTPTWSDWSDFIVGDLTTRAVKVRIVLNGTSPNITPIATRVYVELDMEDRTVGFSASVGTGGATIDFGNDFFVVPEIGISVSNGQEGDSYVITNQTTGGFDISFTNGGTPVARNISGVAKAYGEKAA